MMSCTLASSILLISSRFKYFLCGYRMSHVSYYFCTQGAVKVDSNKCDYLTSWRTIIVQSLYCTYHVNYFTNSGVTIPAGG